MKSIRRGMCVAAVMCAGVGPAVAADAWPSKPLRFVCPYVPGGTADMFTRTIAQKLTEALGQTVVVDNRGGANGGIGTALVASAPGDGYTLLMANSGPMTINPALYLDLAYDPVRDFVAVTQGTSYMYVLVTQPSFPAQTLKELVAIAKAKPGALTYGSTGIGGGNHLSGEIFAQMTQTQLTHVPYKGSAAALTDLLSGQLSFMFDTVLTSIPQVKAGKLRAFAVTGLQRSASLPGTPTLDEAGLKGFELTQWQGVAVRTGTPRPIVDRIYVEVVKALKAPDVIERLAPGHELIGNTPQQFAQVIQRDLAKYRKLVKDAGIKVQ